jgi:hypothetical protein
LGPHIPSREATMQRSAGVTANTVIALVASGLVLILGLLMVVAMIAVASGPIEQPKNSPFPPGVLKAFMQLIPLVYVLPAAWGITTGIGLLRLQNWARISIIIFAALLTTYGVFSGLSAVLFTMVRLPQSPGMDPAAMVFVRAFMVTFTAIQLGIGIWWLIFFNREKVRDQFRRSPALATLAMPSMPTFGTPPPPSGSAQFPSTAGSPSVLTGPARPLSITIIGWYLLIVSFYIPLSVVLKAPAAVFTSVLTGWPAAAFYVVTGAAYVYMGIGLLRLQPAARLFGIGFLSLTLLNSAVFCLAPGGRERMTRLITLQYAMFPWMKAWQETFTSQFDLIPFVMIGMIAAMLLILVLLYFLVTGKAAFAKQEKTVVG